MPPSERTTSSQIPAAQPQAEEDEILDRAPSHPVTTTLLIICSLALILAISLASKELGWYVNDGTRQQLSNFEKTPYQHFDEEVWSAGAASAPNE